MWCQSQTYVSIWYLSIFTIIARFWLECSSELLSINDLVLPGKTLAEQFSNIKYSKKYNSWICAWFNLKPTRTTTHALMRHFATLLDLRQTTNLKGTPLCLCGRKCFATLSVVCCFPFHHNSKGFKKVWMFVLQVPEDKSCFFIELQQPKKWKATSGGLLKRWAAPTSWILLKDWIVPWLLLDYIIITFSSEKALKSEPRRKENQAPGAVCLLLWHKRGLPLHTGCMCAPSGCHCAASGNGCSCFPCLRFFRSHKQSPCWRMLLPNFNASHLFSLACCPT